MKKLITLFLAIFPFALAAQNESFVAEQDSLATVRERIAAAQGKNIEPLKSHINLEFYSSLYAQIKDNKFDELSFKVNRVRLEIYGKLNPKLSYHFRQSFNKYSNPFSLDNLASSIEYANIAYHHPNQKFQLVAGKQFVALGGHEYYVNALRIREFSEFNATVGCYQTGILAGFKASPSQEINLQLVNNRSGSDSDLFVYGRPEDMEKSKCPLLAVLNWNGNFMDDAFNFQYAVGAGNLAKGANIYYATAGNTYDKGPVLAYFDVMYSREGIDSQNRLSVLQGKTPGAQNLRNVHYLTLIADVDYSFHPKWNVYMKGTWETAGIYKAYGDRPVGKYMTDWNAQACIEWCPLNEDRGFKVFLHYLYKATVLEKAGQELGTLRIPDRQRISMGIVYTFL